MIIILHKQQKWILKFRDYLNECEISSAFITWRDVINNLKVDMKIKENGRLETTLIFRELLLTNIEGIYNSLAAPSLDDLQQFVEEDILYAQSEFFALMMQFLSSHSNVVNPVRHDGFALLPIIPINLLYNTQYTNFFSIPEYIYSSKTEDLFQFGLKKPAHFANSLYTPIIPKPNRILSEDSFLAVECIVGDPIIIHVIENEAYATIFFKDEKEVYFEDPLLNQYSIKLTKEYGMKISEILVCRTLENQYFLYYLKGDPDWYKTAHNLDRCWHSITQILSPTYLKHKRNTFIKPKLRPKIIGQYISE